ncbi:MAG: YbjQ family protein, partial [Actinomycetota bacterium]|nr:YbjQ family protein [Actinomycetota bacterium]
ISQQTFTSDLSPRELTALRGIDYEPVGQAFGTSTLAVNRQQATLQSPAPFGGGMWAPWPIRGYFDGELRSRQRALRRMQVECRQLGGSGVVGVRTLRSTLSAGLYEHTVIGTAVRQRHTAVEGTPFLTSLNGSDFASLARSGWLPVTVVLSMVRWTVGFGGRPGTVLGPSSWAFPQAELESLSRLQNQARIQAREQLARQTRAASADGMLLHQLESRWEREENRYHIDVEAYGSAVVHRRSPSSDRALRDLGPVVRLETADAVGY